MHKELLSDNERQMLRQFLSNDVKGEGFRMLKLRIKRNYNCIKQDYKLLEQVMAKLQQKHT